jgi:hypothetical protein
MGKQIRVEQGDKPGASCNDPSKRRLEFEGGMIWKYTFGNCQWKRAELWVWMRTSYKAVKNKSIGPKTESLGHPQTAGDTNNAIYYHLRVYVPATTIINTHLTRLTLLIPCYR